jgi:hypothetical protein
MFIETPMHKALDDVRSASSGSGLVVFVRARDRYWNLPVAIATPEGQYVAGLGTNHHVSIPVPPGKHVYYAFVNHEAAAAVVAEVEAGKVYFVRAELDGEGCGSRGAAPAVQGPTVIRSREDVAQANSATLMNATLYSLSMVGACPAHPHLYPLGQRFGQPRADIDRLLDETQARDVDPELAARFERERGNGEIWQHGLSTGKEALASSDAAALDRMTLHASDGF